MQELHSKYFKRNEASIQPVYSYELMRVDIMGCACYHNDTPHRWSPATVLHLSFGALLLMVYSNDWIFGVEVTCASKDIIQAVFREESPVPKYYIAKLMPESGAPLGSPLRQG